MDLHDDGETLVSRVHLETRTRVASDNRRGFSLGYERKRLLWKVVEIGCPDKSELSSRHQRAHAQIAVVRLASFHDTTDEQTTVIGVGIRSLEVKRILLVCSCLWEALVRVEVTLDRFLDTRIRHARNAGGMRRGLGRVNLSLEFAHQLTRARNAGRDGRPGADEQADSWSAKRKCSDK